jgi:predicted DNA-binding transcriptional regulator YafY
MKTSRVSRMIQLITALQSGQSYGAENLTEILSISKRMVFRDLNELKKVGVPCSFDHKTRGYRIDPKFFFPAPNLNNHEALSLLLLAHKVKNRIHFPFKNSAIMAALKIENDLPEKTKRFCNAALEKISIKAGPQENLDLLDQKFTQLLDAILDKRIAAICYSSPDGQGDMETNICPYHLMYNNYAWYVLAKKESGNETCLLKLSHIKKCCILDKCFVEDKKLDLAEHIGRAWSMAPEGILYNVKLRFLPQAAQSVCDVQWHSTQTVNFQEDGSAIMELRVDGLNEIKWWILSYGDQVQVLGPASLREKIVQIAQNVAKQLPEELSV